MRKILMTFQVKKFKRNIRRTVNTFNSSSRLIFYGLSRPVMGLLYLYLKEMNWVFKEISLTENAYDNSDLFNVIEIGVWLRGLPNSPNL
jgi:hypothetical protein